jgi:regulator of RNase E activity RraA
MARRDLAQRLGELHTAAVSDALRKRGNIWTVMHSSIKPVWPGARLAGPAVTIRCSAGDTTGVGEAIAGAEPGSVLVIDGGGFTESIFWGELYSWTARHAGLAGTVIDGAARDPEGIKAAGYPVFARAITPRGGTGASHHELGIVVECAGVTVRPGDLLLGDEMGVVVVPVELAEEAIAGAEAIVRREERMVELYAQGASPEEVRQALQREGL